MEDGFSFDVVDEFMSDYGFDMDDEIYYLVNVNGVEVLMNDDDLRKII